jgi:hypothetical protein
MLSFSCNRAIAQNILYLVRLELILDVLCEFGGHFRSRYMESSAIFAIVLLGARWFLSKS